MDDKRTLIFTSHGFKSQEIDIAPDISVIESKRKPLIAVEDKALDSNIVELDVGTRARNKAFQDRLDEVWRSTEGWEAKLKTEAVEAAETIMHMKDEYQKHIEKFSLSLMSEMTAIFDHFDNVRTVEETDRVIASEKDLDIYFKKTVPTRIDQRSGEVSRQLQRAYEIFEIEKKKEAKRELKLGEKIDKHMYRTAQRFDDENVLMKKCFDTLDYDVNETFATAAKLQGWRQTAAERAVEVVNEVSQTESRIRQEEDIDVLETVIETQQLLQKTVIMHFGTNSDSLDVGAAGEDEDGGIEFDRLNKRLDKMSARKDQPETEEEKPPEEPKPVEVEPVPVVEPVPAAVAAAPEPVATGKKPVKGKK